MTGKIKYRLEPSKTYVDLFSCFKIEKHKTSYMHKVRRKGFFGFFLPKLRKKHEYSYTTKSVRLTVGKWSSDYWEEQEVLYRSEKGWRDLIKKWEEARRWYNNTKPIEICSCCCSKEKD